MSKSSAVVHSLDRTDRNWLASFHMIWRPAMTAMPVVLSFMALIGYYYTAHQLSQRVLATVCMLMGLVLASGVLRRWVLISKRKLAREQAQKRRAQAQAAAESTAGDELTAAIADVIDDTVDLGALSEATRKLLRMVLVVAGVFGAIAIWQDVFPALAWLDDNPLPGSSGDDPMSWGDVLRCLLTLVITYVVARDVPSLLELVVLQHLPFDQGARYAIATLARYAILTIGIITAARALSITGTSISWLVAAMGVGLGFGLQEIFANFVSGIILLFERPIRVGDIITLGNTTGVVNRIRMRATTIVDWDRKEFVVPNKDLVTERLLNWTLSDQMNRVVVNVGVAYGTDTDRACELLYEVVEANPDVLDEPKPVVVFDSFGDSTLNLILRCFLPSLERRGNVIHDLHTAIHKRFGEEGIEIAFPQRDVNIRSMPPGWAPSSRSDPSAETLANGEDPAPKKNPQSF
jgi:potassium efflux system protein